MRQYTPPHIITPRILTLVAEIAEAVGRLTVLSNAAKTLRLRRINRIRTIQGSLAIDGNTLSEEQIAAILDGKQVIAPPSEVQEVRNALLAYEHFHSLLPHQEPDLLEIHRLLMSGLIDEVGCYRTGSVEVMSGNEVVHMAPSASRVPHLMVDLLHWLVQSDVHPLIKSVVFHYEFEFIHPFADGNGRMGRFWQSLILAQWKPIFADFPVESLVFTHKEEYYQALQNSTTLTDGAPFIEFMLSMIAQEIATPQVAPQDNPQETLQDNPQVKPQVKPQVTPQVKCLLAVFDGEMSREQLQLALGLSDRKSFRMLYLKPALELGFIEMTLPDKPNSRFQRYRLRGEGGG